MAKKLKWVRNGRYGNIFSCKFNGNDIKLGEVRVFKKGEYCLPGNIFPRTKNMFPQTTKTLQSAKKKVQKWFDEFIQSQIN